MSIEEFNEVFASRLRYYLDLYQMTQNDLAKRLHVSPGSVSAWINGTTTPRMDKVDDMCEIFRCKRSDLIEIKPEETYYEEETARIAQEIFEDKDLRALMSAARDANPAAIKAAHAFLKTLKEQELNWHNEDE